MGSTTSTATALGAVVDLPREAVLSSGWPRAERWHVVPVEGGQHAVVEQASGRVLEAGAAGGDVRGQEWSDRPAQRWQLRDAGDGRVALAASGGAGVLTLGDAGGSLRVFEYAGGADQRFTLTATSAQALDLSSDVEEAVTRSGARRMRTRASFLTTERRLIAVTMTWSTMRLGGFDGAVVVLFEDAVGRVVGATPARRSHVTGGWSPGYDSAVQWDHEVADQPWVGRVTAVRALHSGGATGELEHLVERAVAGAAPVADLVAQVRAVAPAA